MIAVTNPSRLAGLRIADRRPGKERVIELIASDDKTQLVERGINTGAEVPGGSDASDPANIPTGQEMTEMYLQDSGWTRGNLTFAGQHWIDPRHQLPYSVHNAYLIQQARDLQAEDRALNADESDIVRQAERVETMALASANMHGVNLGPQDPPQNEMIFNRRRADGTYPPLAGFFDRNT